jgi:hypothetical protein
MELTKSEIVYIFNCISQHVNGTSKSLNSAVGYVSKDTAAFVDLKDRISLMLDGVERGTRLMIGFLEYLKDADEYEEYHEVLMERQESNEQRREAYEKAVRAIKKSRDE